MIRRTQVCEVKVKNVNPKKNWVFKCKDSDELVFILIFYYIFSYRYSSRNLRSIVLVCFYVEIRVSTTVPNVVKSIYKRCLDALTESPCKVNELFQMLLWLQNCKKNEI